MAIGVTFKFLKIVGRRKAKNRKIIPQERSAREETLRIGHTVASRWFNSEI